MTHCSQSDTFLKFTKSSAPSKNRYICPIKFWVNPRKTVNLVPEIAEYLEKFSQKKSSLTVSLTSFQREAQKIVKYSVYIANDFLDIRISSEFCCLKFEVWWWQMGGGRQHPTETESSLSDWKNLILLSSLHSSRYLFISLSTYLFVSLIST